MKKKKHEDFELPLQVVIFLTFIALLISAMGAYSIIQSVNSIKQAPVADDIPANGGKVSIVVLPPESESLDQEGE